MNGKSFDGVVIADAVPVNGARAEAVPLVSVGSATSTLVHAHVGSDGKTPVIFIPEGLELHEPIQVQLPSDKVVTIQLPYGCTVGQAVSLSYSWTSMKYHAKIMQEQSSLLNHTIRDNAPQVATAVAVSESFGKMAPPNNVPVVAANAYVTVADPKAQYKQEMTDTSHLYPSAPASLESSSEAKDPYVDGPKDGKYHSIYEKEGYKGAEYKSVYQTGELSTDGYKGAEYKSVYE